VKIKKFKLELFVGSTKLIDEESGTTDTIYYGGTLEKNRLKTLSDWLHDRHYVIYMMTRTELEVINEMYL
jgi:hypothetical protein